jgi:hypothetical protein
MMDWMICGGRRIRRLIVWERGEDLLTATSSSINCLNYLQTILLEFCGLPSHPVLKEECPRAVDARSILYHQ